MCERAYFSADATDQYGPFSASPPLPLVHKVFICLYDACHAENLQQFPRGMRQTANAATVDVDDGDVDATELQHFCPRGTATLNLPPRLTAVVAAAVNQQLKFFIRLSIRCATAGDSLLCSWKAANESVEIEEFARQEAEIYVKLYKQ